MDFKKDWIQSFFTFITLFFFFHKITFNLFELKQTKPTPNYSKSKPFQTISDHIWPHQNIPNPTHTKPNPFKTKPNPYHTLQNLLHRTYQITINSLKIFSVWQCWQTWTKNDGYFCNIGMILETLVYWIFHAKKNFQLFLTQTLSFEYLNNIWSSK